jgi:hypothetical protein
MLFVLDFKSALAQGILDEGEDVIFMNTDKFTKFMETVEAVTVDMPDEGTITAEDQLEAVAMGAQTFEVEEEQADEDLYLEEEQADEDLYLEEEQADEDLYEDELEPSETVEMGALPLHDEEEEAETYVGDDDIVPLEPVTQPHSIAPPTTDSKSPAPPDPQDLLAGGLRFLSGLAQTLSSPEATQQLVSSIVERDETTGRSYMKIPIDDRQTVVNAMNLLGQLFKGFK